MTRKRSIHPYLNNVRKTIFSNVNSQAWAPGQGFISPVEEDLSQECQTGGKEDSEAERFLLEVVDYCLRMIADPSKRIRKRIKTRHGSGKEVINAGD